jgi:Ca2+-binding RTX toxin-like protein
VGGSLPLLGSAAAGTASTIFTQTQAPGVALATDSGNGSDTTGPAAPVVALATDSGTGGDLISNDGTLALSGMEAGATVAYSVDGGTTWTGSFAAVEGSNTVLVRQTDIAGNASPAATLTFTLDTLASISIDAISLDDTITAAESAQNLTVSGIVSGVEAGRHVTIMLDGFAYDAVVLAGGGWSTTIDRHDVEPLIDGGLYGVSASVSDGAGNNASDSRNVTINRSGDDVIVSIADGLDDLFDGGAGINAVDYGSSSSDLTVDLSTSPGTANGADIGTDTLISIRDVTTGSGDDQITGSTDDNVISTGAGDDNITYVIGGGDDVIDGGTGSDVLAVEVADSTLIAPFNVTVTGGATLAIDTAAGSTPQVTGIEGLQLVLGAGDDQITLTGDLGAAGLSQVVVDADGGDDQIDASGVTGTTSLTLTSGAGSDSIIGSAGSDTISTGADDDNITYYIGGGDDIVDGGDDFDILSVEAADPTLTTPVNVTVTGGATLAIDTATGSNPQVVDIEGLQLLLGAGDDQITLTGDLGTAGVSQVVVDADGGDDQIDASGVTGATSLTLASGDGSDSIIGSAGSDTISAGAGDDNITYYIGGGNDLVDGGDDFDILSVEVADPTLTTPVNVTVTGGATFAIDTAAGTNPQATGIEGLQLVLGAGDDQITLTGDLGTAGVSQVAVDAGDGDNQIDASGVTGATSLTLTSGDGSDSIIGSAGADMISTGAGDDNVTYYIGGGNDIVDGGSDFDILSLEVADPTLTAAVNVTVTGGATLAIDTAAGPDPQVTGIEGLQLLLGAGDDLVTLTGEFGAAGVSQVAVNAGDGDNQIDASGVIGAITMVINGGAGSDRITGTGADDLISGGGGADTFVQDDSFGTDTITDFQTGQDKIDLAAGVTATLDTVSTPGQTIISVDVGVIHYGTINVAGVVTMTDIQFH